MKLYIYILLFIIISCKNRNNEENIKINLKLKYGDLFNKKYATLSFEKNKTAFIGIPENLNYWEVFKINNYKLNVDTLKIPQYTYVLSGKQGTNYIMIIDRNNDKNFSNDTKTITKSIVGLSRGQIADSFNTSKVPTYQIEGNSLQLKISHFPNYYTSTKPEYRIINELQIAFIQIGYWYGEFKHNDTFFKVALKEKEFESKTKILFSSLKDSFPLHSNKDYLPYDALDIVNLNHKNYSVEPNLKNRVLTLRYKGNFNSESIHKGFYFKNYTLTLTDGTKKSIDDLLESKEYLLLDFWGTWCNPCIELMPDTKKMISDYKNIQLIGIALDENKELVDNFIHENNIKNPNHFISYHEADKEGSLIREQRIPSYPYFILLDKNRKIIYRGIGKEGLEKIKIELNKK